MSLSSAPIGLGLMNNNAFYYCISPGGSLYISPLIYMYIFGPRVLISVQVLFITFFTTPMTGAVLQLVGVLAQVKMDRDAVEGLLQTADTVDRHVQEIQQLQVEVEDLEYKLDSSGQGGKSLEEIQVELNSVQRTRSDLGNLSYDMPTMLNVDGTLS
jgi:uncharacterized protein YlxW (UPF0749 family)